MTYAAGTTVPVERTRAEIERTLSRYGADMFMCGWHREEAVIAFRMSGRQIQLKINLPPRDSEEFMSTPARRWSRTKEQAYKAWEQACRQRWRALALVIKAKLEAVEAGIATMEDEFLAYTLLPDGTPFGKWAAPQLEEAYTTGKMPPLLPMLGAGKAP